MEGTSGHYFLQYFNVKSSGFLEPSYRFLQEKPSGRSGEEKGVGVPGRSTWEGEGRKGRAGARGGRGAFPAMQSLKGEPRHYAVAAVHGPLPHHPFDSSSLPRRFSFPSSYTLFIALSFTLSLLLSSAPCRSARRAAFCFSYFMGEKASPPYIPTPTAYGTLSIRSRSNDT